jgi:hypothetical protein
MKEHFPKDCTDTSEDTDTSEELLRRAFKYSIFDKMPPEVRSSHLHGILVELTQSMTTRLIPSEIAQLRYREAREELLNEKWLVLKEVMQGISGAFHSSSIPELPDQYFLFSSDSEAFQASVSKLPKETQKKLMSARGFIWSHQRAWDFVSKGQWPKVYQENYVSPNKDELDNLAYKYLTEMKLTSPSLEWSLINAIVYLTIVDYTNSCHYSSRLPSLRSGQSIAGPLLGIDFSIAILDHDSGWKKVIPKILGLTLGRFLGSILNLVFSAVFAWAITFWTHNSLITWMVFIASAASTWIVMGIRDHRGESEEDERKAKTTMMNLLWDLSSAHDHLARQDFHVGNIRHLLYRLEERNISFGPTVFHLLDKREARPEGGD